MVRAKITIRSLQARRQEERTAEHSRAEQSRAEQSTSGEWWGDREGVGCEDMKVELIEEQEELNALRGSDAQERAAERMALDMHVAELSDEVKILLDKVHELESTRSVVNTTDRNGGRPTLVKKEAH
ncbi:hypothetical protein GUITHDRAFT_116510 [Guillardia theta CCMP2712]|uniref:Uncharacterized protein n=1 Tax=Guillardia theta (strain CCMP2712) TaxID=905079 RepID=L1INC0_GUITC|nr:hypothetical protein GUITHDRAFT_116510 [Guillardia theta CCMP2712]EKX37394.1 hypothetical protein GUITHDRAFT_116510 [Guillardia theta CCMP2712]|eukprot:XP_005824374.1 hypothetical protein GUITHDRAFT_116510 [Guillardia theta CCMP2712]